MMAFGDGFATVIGKRIPLAPLPWNANKSSADSSRFSSSAERGVCDRPSVSARRIDVAIGAAVAGQRDRRVAAAGTRRQHDGAVHRRRYDAGGMAINRSTPSPTSPPIAWLDRRQHRAGDPRLRAAKRRTSPAGRRLDPRHASIIIGGGPRSTLPLLAFFILGTLATKLGYERKARAGLAQEGGGRRGAAHAFANVGVAAICASGLLARTAGSVPLLMGIAALATAACDTTGLRGRPAFRTAGVPAADVPARRTGTPRARSRSRGRWRGSWPDASSPLPVPR